MISINGKDNIMVNRLIVHPQFMNVANAFIQAMHVVNLFVLMSCVVDNDSCYCTKEKLGGKKLW